MTRVIDYYNVFAAISLMAIVLYTFYLQRKSGVQDLRGVSGNSMFYRFAVIGISLLGIGIRIWNLTGLPNGLQQDEASIGYEAFSLANYGIDRNGYHWPVYPITWGSGGGSPLMIYLNILTTKLFGSSIWSIRIIPAVLGCCTLLLFFRVLYKFKDARIALIGLCIIALTPWHIILSRWSLDANTMPFFELLTISLLLYAASNKKTKWYVISCIAGGICLYSYGSATVVIPLFLLLSCIALIKLGRLNIRQLVFGLLAFFITVLPLGLFYSINFLGLPEIKTSWISFPKFTSSHASVFVSFGPDLPITLLRNLRDLCLILSVGIPGEDPWNAMPGYSALYVFLFPVLILGLVNTILRLYNLKRGNHGWNIAKNFDVMDVLFLLLFVSAALFGLFINQDINRMVFIFLPAIYFEVKGIYVIGCQTGKLSQYLQPAVMLVIAVAFLSFSKDYFGGLYNDYSAWVFMPGYGDAITYANEIAERADESNKKTTPVYSTYTDVASPFMITLYYTKYNPKDFLSSVVYRDESAEFRVATSFGRFTFGFPEDDPSKVADPSAILVVTEHEAEVLQETNRYESTSFDNFVVMKPVNP